MKDVQQSNSLLGFQNHSRTSGQSFSKYWNGTVLSDYDLQSDLGRIQVSDNGKAEIRRQSLLLVILASTFYHFNWPVGSPIFNGSFQFILCSLLSTMFILLLDIIWNEKIVYFLLFSSLVSALISSPRAIDVVDIFLLWIPSIVIYSLNVVTSAVVRFLSIDHNLFCVVLSRKRNKTSPVYFRSISVKSKRNSISRNGYVFEFFLFRRSKCSVPSSIQQIPFESRWWMMFAKGTWQTNAESTWMIKHFATCWTWNRQATMTI